MENTNYNVPTEQFNLQPADDKKKLIVMGGAAVVAIIIIIAIIAGIAGGAYKKPIKNLAKGYEEEDEDLIISAYSSMFYDAVDEASGGYLDAEEMIEEEAELEFEEIEEECGKDYKVVIEYGDKEKLNKDDIKDFVDDAEDDYGFEYDADEIKALYEVDVEINAEGDDGDYEILDSTVYVAKVDGEWGIIYIK